MKIRSERILKSGKRVVVVELDAKETLTSIRPNSYYRLGGQLNDIVASHVLEEMNEVSWCSISQGWEA